MAASHSLETVDMLWKLPWKPKTDQEVITGLDYSTVCPKTPGSKNLNNFIHQGLAHTQNSLKYYHPNKNIR